MDKVSEWCTTHWTWLVAGVGYIAFLIVFAKASFARPARRFFGEHESE